jgi:hypothetical protein
MDRRRMIKTASKDGSCPTRGASCPEGDVRGEVGQANRGWCDNPAASSYRLDNNVQDYELTAGNNAMH